MKKVKARRAWEILSLPIGKRILLRREFSELITDLLKSAKPWLERYISSEIFFSKYPSGSVEVALVREKIEEEAIVVLLRLLSGEEHRKGLVPEPDASIEDFLKQLVRKQNIERKYRNRYKIDEVAKDKNSTSLKSPDKGQLIFISGQSFEGLQEKLLPLSNSDGGQDTSPADFALGLVEDGIQVDEVDMHFHVRRLDDATKVALLLTNYRAHSKVGLEEFVSIAKDIDVCENALARYVSRLKNVLSLRGQKYLTQGDIATVIDVNRAQLKQMLAEAQPVF